MMKKYKVCGFSALMDAEMNTNDAEQASDLFETMMNSDCYYKAHIMDNYTGELYIRKFSSILSIDQSLQIGTAAGNQNRNFRFLFHGDLSR